MPKDCYRCGQPVAANTVFCPNCNAPQIRVVTAQPETEVFSAEQAPDDPVATTTIPPPPMPRVGSIQWNAFFRIVSPMAAFAGFLTFLFLPAGLLIFPYTTVRAIARYRPLHLGALQSGHGARLGAFAALLSFLSFLIFSLSIITVSHAALLNKLQEIARQTSDPQTLQAIQWFTTDQGFAVGMALSLTFFLLVFLILGAITGALVANKIRTRF
ncbi:MAG TPA: zinc ribbon domain-containing protein [Candidatus Angelobacter sp.]|nr:zinc ribbon domain-containing protein [Candidatus Angelobacter sp.]